MVLGILVKVSNGFTITTTAEQVHTPTTHVKAAVIGGINGTSAPGSRGDANNTRRELLNNATP